MRDDDPERGPAAAAPGDNNGLGIASDPALWESGAETRRVADRAARDAVERATPEDWQNAWNAGRNPGGSRGIETRADAHFILRETGTINDGNSEDWDVDRRGTDELVGLARIAAQARAQVLNVTEEERAAAVEHVAMNDLRLAVDTVRTDADLQDAYRAGKQTDAARGALAEIRQGLAEIDRNVAQISDPTARTLLEAARADLAGAFADLTGDRQVSERYGQVSRRVQIGAKDLAPHGARFRARFSEVTAHLKGEAARIGVDLRDVGARLSLGRVVTAGQVQDWDDRDLVGVLGKAGVTRDGATREDLDRAATTLERFNQSVLETYTLVVTAVREEVAREIGRGVGNDGKSVADGTAAKSGRTERSHSHTGADGVAL